MEGINSVARICSYKLINVFFFFFLLVFESLPEKRFDTDFGGLVQSQQQALLKANAQ